MSHATVAPVAAGPVIIGTGHPLAFIVGPCVIESAAHVLDLATEIAAIDRRKQRGASVAEAAAT